MNKLGILLLSTILMACSPNNFQASTASEESNKIQEDPNIAKQYIVVFKDKIKGNAKTIKRGQRVNSMVKKVKKTYQAQALKSFSKSIAAVVYKMTPLVAAQMAADEDVSYVEEDQIITINANQVTPTWGLDRIDQESLALDQLYKSANDGEGVQVYVLDTGVLNSHINFEARAVSGIDTASNDDNATDCNGHGTHVAGTIASKDYGVAKKANIIGVRVLDCRGSGRLSDVIDGIEWVTQNHQKPAVANMSLGGSKSRALDDAVTASIAAGITYVVAAGNENRDACNGSPAGVPAAITVGSSTRNDKRSSFSNFGPCVDIFAPGSDITSTWINSNSSTNTISGTSMASPHVAGAAALYLSENPLASPSEVAQALTDNANANSLSSIKAGSPNLLLNVEFLEVPVVIPDPEVLEVENLAGHRNDRVSYELAIPAGAARLRVEMSGGFGDADLYVRLGSEPALRAYDCRPYTTGNNEICSFDAPAADKAYIMIRAYRSYSGVKLKAVAL